MHSMENTPSPLAIAANAQSKRVRALTKRQQLFITHYLLSHNATRAAREAGYSSKTAYAIGHENLHKPAIKAILDDQKAQQQQAWISSLQLGSDLKANITV